MVCWGRYWTNESYPAYEDSGIDWIGKLPSSWEVSSLKFVSYINKKTLPENTNGDHEIQYIDIGNVNQSRLINRPQKMFFSDSPSRARRIVQREDTIISTVRTYLKAVAFIDRDEENLIVSTGFAVLTPNSKIQPKYLNYLVSSQGFVDTVTANSVGVSYPAITSTELARIPCWLPSFREQQSIADFLDRKTAQIDTLIEKNQRQIELLKEQRTAMINQAVTKGLDPNVPMKDSCIEWLGEVPSHWKIGKLKYFTRVNPSKKAEIVLNEPSTLVTFLPMEKVNENGTYDTSYKRPIKELRNGFTYFEEHDVILAKITPCFENGKGAYLEKLNEKIGFGSTEFHVIRAVKGITNSQFLYYLTKTQIFMSLGKAVMYGAAGQKRVPTTFVEDFPFACPPINEQISIAEYLNKKTRQINGLIQKIDFKIHQYQEYRNTLISAAVTGKIDVREHSNEH